MPYYSVKKFDHETLIEDVFEGPDLTSAIEARYDEAKKNGDMVVGLDLCNDEITKQDFVKWVLNDSYYEFNTFEQSASPIVPVIVKSF